MLLLVRLQGIILLVMHTLGGYENKSSFDIPFTGAL